MAMADPCLGCMTGSDQDEMAPAAGQGSALETTAAAALAVDKSNSARSETGRQKKEKKYII
jgi:hypothetical protein